MQGVRIVFGRGFLAALMVGFLITLGSGCSSDDDNFVATSSAPTQFPTLTVGSVLFGGPVAGARVTVTMPNGQPPAPPNQTTDSNGLFFLDSPLPVGSKVSAVGSVVVAQGASQPLQLEVLVGRGGAEQKITINYPLHLVAALLQESPNLTYDQAVDEVKRLLGISEPWQLDTIEETRSSPFHHGTFLQAAAAAGGIDVLTGQLLQLSKTGGTRRFILSQGSLSDGESDIFGAIVSNLCDGGVSFAENNVPGWIVRLLSLAFGGPNDPFAGINGQFLNLNNELTQISERFQQEQIFTDLNTNVVSPITGTYTALTNAADSFVTPTPPLAYYTTGSQSTLMAAITSGVENTALSLLFDSLTGIDTLATKYDSSATGVQLRPERTYAALTYPIVGVDSRLDQYGGYGAFSDHTVSPVESIHQYYLGFATLAANLLAESAHSTIDSVESGQTSLAEACRAQQLAMLGTSNPDAPGVAARRKQVQQLLPPSLSQVSSQVFIDREYGLMWCTQSYGDLTFQQSQSLANTLQMGPYNQGWRIPHQVELQHLSSRINGGWINRTAQQRTGKRSSVLDDLGFDLSKMSDTHHVWGFVYNFDGTLRPLRYSLDTGDISFFFADGKHDLLLVRSYTETNANTVFTDPELSPVPNASLSILGEVGSGGATQLKASMPFQCPIGGQFTINGQTINPVDLYQYPIQGAANGSQRPAKDITDRVVWTSSNDAIALVSNLDSEEGKVYWRTPAPSGGDTCTFTASFQGTQASITLQRPTNLQWQVDSILLCPYEEAVSFVNVPQAEVTFIATLFLKNPATGDRTAFRSSALGGEAPAPSVTWTLEKLDGTPIPTGFADPQSSTLVINATDTTDDSVIVKATSQGVTAQTTLYLIR